MVPEELRSRNPWKRLGFAAPLVLEDDLPLIESYNTRHKGSLFEIITDILPEPFIGSPAAPIWLLSLNPGFHPDDRNVGELHKVTQRANLLLESKSFWGADPVGPTPGHAWWRKYLGELIRARGSDWCMSNLFVAELFPYHSARFKWHAHLPSHTFTRDLVRWGCLTGKRFIVMRQTKRWLELVPELGRARRTELRNKRNAWISRKNLVDPTILES